MCRPLLGHLLAALGELLGSPPGELHFATSLGDGGVLVGFELGVVVGELVVEDGDGHAVEDDTEGDAGEGKDAAQVGLREDVSVAHGGNTHLEEMRQSSLSLMSIEVLHFTGTVPHFQDKDKQSLWSS